MKPLLFLDVETTGLDPWVHEIIELGAIHVDGESLTELATLELKVQPTRLGVADRQALAVNGFELAQWSEAVSLESALQQLAPLLEDAMLAGHNIAMDRNFLEAAFRQTGIPRPHYDHHVLDTASLAWPFLGRKNLTLSLVDVCESFGVSGGPQHRALHDARRSLHLVRKLLASTSLTRAITKLACDERRIVENIITRIDAGRRSYGPWLVHDGRPYTKEAIAEVFDGMAYLAAELVRLGACP